MKISHYHYDGGRSTGWLVSKPLNEWFGRYLPHSFVNDPADVVSRSGVFQPCDQQPFDFNNKLF